MKVYIILIICFSFIKTGNSQILLDRGITPDGTVFDMALKNNILYVGGSFDRVGYTTGGVARLNDDSMFPDLDFTYIDGDIHAIISDGSDGWFIAGDFERAGNLNRTYLVHILPTMEVDPIFQPDINNMVYCLALEGNTLYLGGRFTMVDGEQRMNLAAYDISSNSLTAFNPSPNSWVYDIAVHNNELLLAGRFSSIGTSTLRGLASISVTNGQVQSFPELSSGEARDLFIDGNTLYVAGSFSGVC